MALAVTVLVGMALFVLLGKDPVMGLQHLLLGADQERLRSGARSASRPRR
jgi:hypothetical protein